MLATSLLHPGRHPLRAGFAAGLLAAVSSFAPLRATGPPPSEAAPLLAPGAEIPGELEGGSSRSFTLSPSPGAGAPRLLVTVEQEGIDLALELRGADGALLAAVDGPTDSEGTESLLVPSGLAAPLTLRLASPNPGSAPGRFRLRLTLLAQGTPGERQRIEAERTSSEAGARNREGAAGSASALRQAAGLYDRARALWRTLRDGTQEARAAHAAAAVELALGEPRPALERALAALALYRESGDRRGEEGALGTAGLARTALGDHAGAIAAQTSALEIAARPGPPAEEGKVRNNLGYALHARGDLTPARAQYQKALELFGRAGERGWWEAAVLQNLAAVETALGEPESALASHRRVLARQRELGDRRGEALTLNNLGVLLDGLGEDGEAREAYGAALTLVRSLGDRYREAALLHNLGLVDHRRGDLPRARRNLEAALAIRRETGDRPGEARSEAALASVLERSGERAAAREAVGRAVALATKAGDRGAEVVARQIGRAHV
jgi:tetratricopeptide (TPR) repeat protein